MHDFHSAYTTVSTTCSIWPYAVFLKEERLPSTPLVDILLLLSAALCSYHSALSFNYLPVNEVTQVQVSALTLITYDGAKSITKTGAEAQSEASGQSAER